MFGIDKNVFDNVHLFTIFVFSRSAKPIVF